VSVFLLVAAVRRPDTQGVLHLDPRKRGASTRIAALARARRRKCAIHVPNYDKSRSCAARRFESRAGHVPHPRTAVRLNAQVRL
jgi:hypothetical protein